MGREEIVSNQIGAAMRRCTPWKVTAIIAKRRLSPGTITVVVLYGH